MQDKYLGLPLINGSRVSKNLLCGPGPCIERDILLEHDTNTSNDNIYHQHSRSLVVH